MLVVPSSELCEFGQGHRALANCWHDDGTAALGDAARHPGPVARPEVVDRRSYRASPMNSTERFAVRRTSK